MRRRRAMKINDIQSTMDGGQATDRSSCNAIRLIIQIFVVRIKYERKHLLRKSIFGRWGSGRAMPVRVVMKMKFCMCLQCRRNMKQSRQVLPAAAAAAAYLFLGRWFIIILFYCPEGALISCGILRYIASCTCMSRQVRVHPSACQTNKNSPYRAEHY